MRHEDYADRKDDIDLRIESTRLGHSSNSKVARSDIGGGDGRRA
jgi:hypothetical protein